MSKSLEEITEETTVESGEDITEDNADEETPENDFKEDIAEEPPVEELKIYNVILDENGYFTGMACIAKYSRFEGGVDVESLPPTEDVIQMKAYKMVEGAWELDEARYNTLLAEEESKEVAPVQPTQKERIAALEDQVPMLTECILEMSELLYV